MERASKYSVCTGCEALLAEGQVECTNCGTMAWGYEPAGIAQAGGVVEDAGSHADTAPYWQYMVFVALSAEELTTLLNDRAMQGWEPINVYGGTILERPEETVHFAVMRRRSGAR